MKRKRKGRGDRRQEGRWGKGGRCRLVAAAPEKINYILRSILNTNKRVYFSRSVGTRIQILGRRAQVNQHIYIKENSFYRFLLRHGPIFIKMLFNTCITWCSTWLVYNLEIKFEMHRVLNHITEKTQKGSEATVIQLVLGGLSSVAHLSTAHKQAQSKRACNILIFVVLSNL